MYPVFRPSYTEIIVLIWFVVYFCVQISFSVGWINVLYLFILMYAQFVWQDSFGIIWNRLNNGQFSQIPK